MEAIGMLLSVVGVFLLLAGIGSALRMVLRNGDDNIGCLPTFLFWLAAAVCFWLGSSLMWG